MVVFAAPALLARVGELLDRRRIAVYCAILLIGELAMAAFLVAGTYGLVAPLEEPTSTDFVSFYAAGSLANAGTPELAYNEAAHHAAIHRTPDPCPWHVASSSSSSQSSKRPSTGSMLK